MLQQEEDVLRKIACIVPSDCPKFQAYAKLLFGSVKIPETLQEALLSVQLLHYTAVAASFPSHSLILRMQEKAHEIGLPEVALNSWIDAVRAQFIAENGIFATTETLQHGDMIPVASFQPRFHDKVGTKF